MINGVFSSFNPWYWTSIFSNRVTNDCCLLSSFSKIATRFSRISSIRGRTREALWTTWLDELNCPVDKKKRRNRLMWVELEKLIIIKQSKLLENNDRNWKRVPAMTTMEKLICVSAVTKADDNFLFSLFFPGFSHFLLQLIFPNISTAHSKLCNDQ